MAEELNDSDVVTMQDLLDDEKELLDEASAVLSGSDEKNCNGLKKRQALYSCLTCISQEEVKKDFSKAIGICLGCSLSCHEKHELVELYTKRNFECECGVKTGSAKCQLDPCKSSYKELNNSHNQNFAGLYCTCHRPYPDPESKTNEEMMQCCVCEDWFHSKHLKFSAALPSTNKEVTTDLICGECISKNEFLVDYVKVLTSSNSEGETSNVDVTSPDVEGEPSSKKLKLSTDACRRPKPSEDDVKFEKGSSIFCKDGWRKELCCCENCKEIYENLKVQFLIDVEDTVVHYEEKGKGNERPSNYDASLEALNSLPRVNQINAITGYNRLKDKLFEFLQTFVVNNQIVTEEDIQRFFRNMKESNENQPMNQPHFCR